VKIKSRNNLLNDIIKDAEKYPKDWKAVIGKDENRFSNDYYIFNPNTGIYLLKEYQKNPYEIKGMIYTLQVIAVCIYPYMIDNVDQRIQ